MFAGNLKEFTRGGQMTMHAFRMIGQASKCVVKVTLVLSLLIYLGFFMLFTDPYERYVVTERLINKAKITFNHDNYYKNVRINTPEDNVGSMMAGKFVEHRGAVLATYHIQKAAFLALGATLFTAVAVILLLIKIFIARSRRLAKSSAIRGTSFESAKNLRKLIIKRGQNSDLSLGNVPLIKNSETQHVLLTGTTGAGKSVALTSLMDQIRDKNQKAIVYDSDGSFISSYYRPSSDIILNPLDQRSPCWNIWQECRDSADFEAFAESLMPLHLSNSDPFWIKSARLIFSSAAFALREENPTTRKLLALLLTESLDDIKAKLKNTPAETLVSDKIEKTALSVKATLSGHCKSLVYLPDEKDAKELFSIRNWIRDEHNTGWLFISTNKEKVTALRSLMSAWLDVAVRSILSLPKSFHRRIWFFMDELPSLNELPSLKEVLAEGRKYGSCFVATIQDIHQLRLIYGREATEALLSFFNTKLCFRTLSTESAKWAERAMGSQEVIDLREGYSYGANDIRDGVTLNQERRKTPVIMDSEFLQLSNLEGYLKLPGDFPVTKLKFKAKDRAELEKALIERKMQDVYLVEQNVVSEKTSKASTAKSEKEKEQEKPMSTKQALREEKSITDERDKITTDPWQHKEQSTGQQCIQEDFSLEMFDK